MFKYNLSVLFVDDQKSVLKAVERVIRRQAKNWNIHFANSPFEAIDILRSEPIKVIVSDMRMPDMDGVELLEHVRDNHPNVVRFMLSGYSETDRTLDAVRVAHQFFSKPFSTQELVEALQLTHTLYKRVRNPGLQSLIASIDRLPTPRRVFYEISEELNNPYTNTERIADIVARDTAIAGKILQVSNSAFFGQSNPVDNINDAVKILGTEIIRSLILIVGIASDHKEFLKGIISLDLYSEHCMEVGTIARCIARKRKMPVKDQNSLFTIGLLHDIGKLILIKKYAELYLENNWKEDPYSTKLHISQIEKLAEKHAEIGASLIALWGLPPRIVNTIAFYQDKELEDSEDHEYTIILHLAEAITSYIKNKRKGKFSDSGLYNSKLTNLLPDVDLDEYACCIKEQQLSSINRMPQLD